MLDDASWVRLIEGISAATQKGTLQWEQISGRSGQGISGLSRVLLDQVSGGKMYRAVTRSAMYELASADALGHAPHELSVWEQSGGVRDKAVGTLKSSLHHANSTSYALNVRLENLFNVVSSSIEPSESVVDRLLEGLEQ